MSDDTLDTATLRCRILGHNYTDEIQDITQCDPGYYKPIRYCRRCDHQEDIIDSCVRDDAKWAAHQVEELIEGE